MAGKHCKHEYIYMRHISIVNYISTPRIYIYTHVYMYMYLFGTLTSMSTSLFLFRFPTSPLSSVSVFPLASVGSSFMSRPEGVEEWFEQPLFSSEGWEESEGLAHRACPWGGRLIKLNLGGCSMGHKK